MNSIGGSTVTGHFDQFLDDASATKPDHYTIYSKGSARVERLIPDPLGVTPGIILSQSSGSMTASTPSGNTICGTTVDTTTALVQSSVPVLCPVGRTYQFTTAPSGTTL